MLFTGLGIVIAGSAMSLAPHRVATAGGMTAVTVTNPSLAVTQSGPWNVGINGTPSVNANITNQVPVTGTVNANVSFPANQQVTLALDSILRLGKLPSQQVVLRAFVPFSAACPWLVSDTGQCYSGIPAGSVLVVTDVDWEGQLAAIPPSPSGHTCSLSFKDLNQVFVSSAASDVDGNVDKSEHLSGGLYINPAVQGSLAPVWSLSPSCKTNFVILRGYLVPNQ